MFCKRCGIEIDDYTDLNNRGYCDICFEEREKDAEQLMIERLRDR